MSEEYELSGQYEDDKLESEVSILNDIISTYIGRIKEINEQHKLGVDVDNQTRIGDLISDGSRNDGESRKEYKMRRKAENLIIKHYSRGVRGR